jgi:hypothetical protein
MSDPDFFPEFSPSVFPFAVLKLPAPGGSALRFSLPTFFLLPLFILYGFLKAGFHIERIESS